MGQAIGIYLSEPDTTCESFDGSCNNFNYGVSTMRGWRKKQEDAYNCVPNFMDKNTSLFAVYDGHGGIEVAVYCKKNFPRLIKQYVEIDGDISEALTDAFLECDMCLQGPDGIKELNSILDIYDPDAKIIARNVAIVEALFKSSTSKDSAVEAANNATSSKDDSQSSDILVKLIQEYAASKNSHEIKCQNLNNESSSENDNEEKEVIEVEPNDESSSGIDNGTILNSSGECEEQEVVEVNPNDDSCSEIDNGPILDSDGECVKKVIQVKNNNESSSEIDNDMLNPDVECKEKEVIEVKSNDDSDMACTSSSEANSPSKSPLETNLDSIILNEDNGECSDEDSAESNDESNADVILYDPEKVSELDLPDTDSEDSDYDPEKECGNLALSESEESVDVSEESDDVSEESDETSEESDEISEESNESNSSIYSNENYPPQLNFPLVDNKKKRPYKYPNIRVLENPEHEPGYQSGSTAVIALIQENIVYIANAGDSRCVLCHDGNAVDMSVDHKPEDTKECERITNACGEVDDDGRINGGLNLSRALGDNMYKQKEGLGIEEQLVICIPDIKVMELKEKDEFLVLASDGIWNSMSSQEVVDYIKIRMETGDAKLSEICEELFYHCLSSSVEGDGTGCDNMTCIIIDFHKNFEAPHSSKQGQIQLSKKRPIEEIEFTEAKKSRLE